MQPQYESNIEQTYNAEDWSDAEDVGTYSSSKQHRKESKRDRQDDRKAARIMKRSWE